MITFLIMSGLSSLVAVVLQYAYSYLFTDILFIVLGYCGSLVSWGSWGYKGYVQVDGYQQWWHCNIWRTEEWPPKIWFSPCRVWGSNANWGCECYIILLLVFEQKVALNPQIYACFIENLRFTFHGKYFSGFSHIF